MHVLLCLLLCTPWILGWMGIGSCFQDGGDRLWPCGDRDYNRTIQCCCKQTLTVHDIPEHDCQCCGNVAYRWHQPKPEHCLSDCGAHRFHLGTQRCCDGTVFNSTSDTEVCCGRQVISTLTHRCCGHRFVVNRTNYKCCEGRYPYHLTTMRCQRKSGPPMTSLKFHQEFLPQKLCQLRLPFFDSTWPAPRLPNNNHTYIRAIPESCKVSVTKKPNGVTQIRIPFFSFATTGRRPVPDCLQTSKALELVVKVGPGHACAGLEDLKRYLQGQILDLVIKKDVACRAGPPRRGVLRLREGSNAVVFMAGPSQAVMAKSLLPPPRS